MISCFLLNIGLFIKGSEFKEILRTCTEPTSLLHEKTTRDNLLVVHDGYNKGFRVQRNPRIYTDPQSFPYSKELHETTPSSSREEYYIENKNLSSVFFIFSLTNIVIICSFQEASQSSAGTLRNATAVYSYGNIPEITTVCVNNLSKKEVIWVMI